MDKSAASTSGDAFVRRIQCQACGAQCVQGEQTCWQCGAPLTTPAPPVEPPASAPEFIQLDAKPAPVQHRTLTGEIVEEVPSVAPGTPKQVTQPPGPLADVQSSPGEPPVHTEEVMVLTFCKLCGFQNAEGARECAKCGRLLEVVSVQSVREVAPLPRVWGFDVLGLAWIALGFAAVYCGQFLIKTDPNHPGTTWADYFWTGVVVCAPGILIFMRHVFCKILFWAMTLGSIMVWSVIGFIWLFVGLRVSDNGQVGLIWLALLSGLSVVSYATVRMNDAFDFTF